MQLNMLEAMNIYVNVVEQGSFIRAAEVLELHRPAVTRAVQNLEHDLGVKLLHRTTRQVSMTDEGEEFYQRCLSLLSELDDVRRLFSRTQPPKGRLRLDVPITLARAVIIPALGDFQNRYPDIEIVLGTSDRKIDLIAERVDCVIRLGELNDSSFVARRLGTAAMVTCAAPSYLAKHGTPHSIDELMKSHRCPTRLTLPRLSQTLLCLSIFSIYFGRPCQVSCLPPWFILSPDTVICWARWPRRSALRTSSTRWSRYTILILFLFCRR